MIKKFLIFIISLYLLVGIYSVNKADILTLSYLTVEPWWKHYEYGMLPLPLNSWLSSRVVKKGTEQRVVELEDVLEIGIDGILLIQWDLQDKQREKILSLSTLLVKSGANIDFVNERTGCSAMHQAIMRNDQVAIKFLLEHGVNLDYFSLRDDSPSLCTKKPELELKGSVTTIKGVGDN